MHLNEFSPDPFKQFKLWLEHATASQEPDPTAFSLATASGDGVPSVRTLLYKGIAQCGDDPAFAFYTNTCSQKGEDLRENPRAEMLFYWAPIYRQLRIAGDVVLLSREQTERYFFSRSFSSQLSALVSYQSHPIESREALEKEVDALKKKYDAEKQLPCPSYWQGYGLVPKRFEFWVGRDHRLHDRFCYTKNEEGHWEIGRLAP